MIGALARMFTEIRGEGAPRAPVSARETLRSRARGDR